MSQTKRIAAVLLTALSLVACQAPSPTVTGANEVEVVQKEAGRKTLATDPYCMYEMPPSPEPKTQIGEGEWEWTFWVYRPFESEDAPTYELVRYVQHDQWIEDIPTGQRFVAGPINCEYPTPFPSESAPPPSSNPSPLPSSNFSFTATPSFATDNSEDDSSCTIQVTAPIEYGKWTLNVLGVDDADGVGKIASGKGSTTSPIVWYGEVKKGTENVAWVLKGKVKLVLEASGHTAEAFVEINNKPRGGGGGDDEEGGGPPIKNRYPRRLTPPENFPPQVKLPGFAKMSKNCDMPYGAPTDKLTVAGRGLMKHASRMGKPKGAPMGTWPTPFGTNDQISLQGRQVAEEIMMNPGNRIIYRNEANIIKTFNRPVIDIREPPTGRGVRFGVEGDFIGFLDPPFPGYPPFF